MESGAVIPERSRAPVARLSLEADLRPVTAVERSLLLLAVFGPLAAVVAGMVQVWNRWVTPGDVALLLTLHVLTGIGVTVGYHRMLTHNSFVPHPVVRFILLALGSMAVQGGALHWASVHMQHHARSDRDDDPHSPLRGLFHAHVGWMLEGFRSRPQIYGRSLLRDRMVMFFERTFLLWVVAGAAIAYAVGGWQGVLWGFGVRVFLTQHVTWSVNSVCHTFGRRSFQTSDLSRNNWLVGLLAMGEGWHNNHHAFPRSAMHGLARHEVDVSGWIIQALERLGLARDVIRPSPEQIRSKLIARGDAAAP
jgi:stearoyl-CoA desaturase (delta-9 desaturase)